MQKLITATLLLVFLVVLQNNVFAGVLNCKFKAEALKGVTTIQLSDDSLLLNNEMEIPLSKSRVNCGASDRQVRLDGMALGYQVVLKSCLIGEMEGHLIDAVNMIAAEVSCNKI